MYYYVTYMTGRNTLVGADNSKCNTIHIYLCTGIHLLRLLSGKCWEKYDMKYIKKKSGAVGSLIGMDQAWDYEEITNGVSG